MPSMQSEQVEPASAEYFPAAQLEHTLAPALDDIPMAQSVQALRPVAAEYLPATQLTQFVAEAPENFPITQLRHTDASLDKYVPAEQESRRRSRLNWPEANDVHDNNKNERHKYLERTGASLLSLLNPIAILFLDALSSFGAHPHLPRLNKHQSRQAPDCNGTIPLVRPKQGSRIHTIATVLTPCKSHCGSACQTNSPRSIELS